MGKVVVFDSGLGSLSIIHAIRKVTKADIVYFADQKNYPYGKKSNEELRKIIDCSIESLEKKFKPDIIIIGSNTPTLLFPELFVKNKAIMGVLPPLIEAQKKTKTKSIAILGTRIVTQSKQINRFIEKKSRKNIQVHKIDASRLIDLVETGKFIYKKQHSKTIIKKILATKFEKHNVDTATLSSTHLPFLLPILEELFPQILFLDPAMQVATCLLHNKFFSPSKTNTLKIFSSSKTKTLERNLKKIKIKNKVKLLQF